MSDAVWVALITLAGTIITVLASAAAERGKNKQELEKQLKAFKKASDDNDREIKSTIEAVASKLESHIAQEEVNDLKQRRIRIIRCADEIAAGRLPGKEYVEDILEDVDYYETWCGQHPEYHNGKGKLAIACLTSYYKKLMGVHDNDA